MTQFYFHQAGAALMFIGLFLLYGGFVEPGTIEPVLGVGSILVFIGMVLMKFMFIKSCKKSH